MKVVLAGRRRPSRSEVSRLSLGALGVVFGDIGTSPLYALKTVFSADGGAVPATPADVYGVISLVFWTIALIVSVKYVGFIMRADNHGEGGILALTALVETAGLTRARVKSAVIALGILGACLFIGDSVITPAISVLSAAEGLETAAPGMASWVLPISVAVLVALFSVQRFGTEVMGWLFGPVMAVWFTVLGLLGINEIRRQPEVLGALSPTYAVSFFMDRPAVAVVALGSVVLVVTGAEALYADMGHFGRAPIRRSWFLLVFPALTLNYLAQGSLILRSPSSTRSPFFLLAPEATRIPMVVLATAATIIASQAVISGAFSVARQAVQLGYLPWLTVRHTGEDEEGQVYVPAVNLGLFVSVVTVAITFGSSAALASAYGVAVTGTFILTTVLFLVIARARWRTQARWIALAAAVFLTVELTFFTAALAKVPHGGWLPLLIAASLLAVTTTWRRGQQLLAESRERAHRSLHDLMHSLAEMRPRVRRVPGIAVFLTADQDVAPPALLANVEHNHVMHRHVVTLTIQTERRAHVPPAERLAADHTGVAHHRATQLTARFGYKDHPNVPAALHLAISRGLLGRVGGEDISYFLSTTRIEPIDAPNMSTWRKRLYVTMAHNQADEALHYRLPADLVVTMGEEVQI